MEAAEDTKQAEVVGQNEGLGTEEVATAEELTPAGTEMKQSEGNLQVSYSEAQRLAVEGLHDLVEEILP